MKPFTIPSLNMSGKKFLPYQCTGTSCEDFWHRLKNEKITACSLPEGHDLTTAWGVWLSFECGVSLGFSSSFSQVDGWEEVGSLNINFIANSVDIFYLEREKIFKIEIPPIRCVSAEKIIYEDEEIIVECGIALIGEDGQEIVISAGIPPGSVSVQAPFSEGISFEPEFPLSMCRRQNL